MNKQIFFIALLSLMLLSLGTALAAPSLSVTWLTAPSDIYQGYNKTVIYNVTNDGDSNLTLRLSSSVSSLGLSTSESSISLPMNASTSRSFAITTNDTANLGAHAISITAYGVNANNTNATIVLSASFKVLYPYCGNISGPTEPITLAKITNFNDIDGEDFKPLDTFDIKVKVENNDDDDSHKVLVSAVLVKEGDTEPSDDTEVEKKYTVEESESDTLVLPMEIPADLDSGTYYLYVKAYNDDDEDNCMQQVMKIDVKRSTTEVIFDNPNAQANVSCGSTLLVDGKLYNIGKNDEEKVKIVYSDSFGNSDTAEFNSLDSGDDASVNMAFKIPRNATEGAYSYTVDIYYDYDEDDDSYDEREAFVTMFKVAGSCQQIVSSQSITTEASTAITGIESEVRVTISNTGTTSQTFAISASADWATIASITPSSVALNAGEEKEIIIKINTKADTEIGVHDLTITVQHSGASESEIVPVNVQKSSVKSNLFDQLAFQFKYNTAWVIIDTVLVLAIIIVVVLLLTSKKN